MHFHGQFLAIFEKIQLFLQKELFVKDFLKISNMGQVLVRKENTEELNWKEINTKN